MRGGIGEVGLLSSDFRHACAVSVVCRIEKWDCCMAWNSLYFASLFDFLNLVVRVSFCLFGGMSGVYGWERGW